MNYLRTILAAFTLTIAGCMTIGSLSYTTEDGQTVSVGFQNQQSDGKSIRGFQK
jgi:hypothetical protein